MAQWNELQKHEVKTKEGSIQVEFYNGAPLNDSHTDMEVNYFECTVKDKSGKISGCFSCITDLLITQDNV